MMTPPLLPTLAGLAWSRKKSPKFNTRVADHASGREVRVALAQYPIYEFEAVYNGLTSAASPAAAQAGLGGSSLQSLMGFFLQLQGQFGTFLYADPDDSAITGQSVGLGDGTTVVFLLPRTLGGFTEPTGWVTAVNAVYLNGVAIGASFYELVPPNILLFANPPAAGAAITADFTFAFNCRFLDDQMDFEEFMSSLWKLGSMKFRSVKSSTALLGPAWLPTPEGQIPIVYADFVLGNYWYNGQTYSTFSAWLTATGGSFTRAQASLYTGADGFLHSAAVNVPRFDYDTAGNPVGLLLEPVFGNGLLFSQAFSNADWTKTDATATDNSVKAPDSTTTGSLITENGSGSQAHEVSQSLTSPSLQVVSIYARAGTGNYLNIAASTANANEYVQAIFDLSQGGAPTEASVGSYLTTNGIVISQAFAEPAPDVGDGWVRCTLGFRFLSGPASVTFHFGLAAAAHGNTYSSSGQELHASGGRTIYLWGAQVPQSPEAPLTYNATTNVGGSAGGDSFYLGATWDVAANSLTYFQQTDVRGDASDSAGFFGNGYSGTTDSWVMTGPPQTTVFQEPTSSNPAATQTGLVPGVNGDAMRVDATVATISDNGNAPVASAVGTARPPMTKITPAGHQATTVRPVRLRKMAAWATGLTNASLSVLSAVPGNPVPALASTIDSGDANWVGFPGFTIMPSGYLLATYVRYNSSTQGARPSQIMYRTSPSAAGPWSNAAVVVSNANSAIDVNESELVTLPGGTILGIMAPQNYTSPYTSGAGTLQVVTGTENADHSVTWAAPVTITGSPFFGTDAAGTESGDFSASAPILLPNGKWMQLLYGFQAGASVTSVGAIFSTTPQTASSWGSFIIIANGGAFTPAMAFSEANGFIDASNNIVLIARQDIGGYPSQVPGTGYWRIVCPAGSDPTVAGNWKAPTFVAFDTTVGKPDVLGLGNNGMWMMTRGGIGTNALIGYNVNWNAGQTPFPGNRASLLNPTFNDRQYWYSQSQLLNANTLGTVLAADGPVGIYFIQSPFTGVGQSQ